MANDVSCELSVKVRKISRSCKEKDYYLLGDAKYMTVPDYIGMARWATVVLVSVGGGDNSQALGMAPQTRRTGF